jgi:predicted DNA-binding transcriptional regulator AlpA
MSARFLTMKQVAEQLAISDAQVYRGKGPVADRARKT